MGARAAPLVLTILGFAGIGTLWVWRLGSADGWDAAFIAVAGVFYALWLLWESRVSARELAKGDASHDRKTMELAAAAKIAFLVAALVGGGIAPDAVTGFAGIVLLGLGIFVRIAAIRALGAAYSHRIRPPLALVTRGPYAIVRHPAYLGTLVAHTGLAVVFFGPWSVAALLGAWWPAVVLRASIEDRFLLESPDYRAYALSVRARLVPGLW